MTNPPEHTTPNVPIVPIVAFEVDGERVPASECEWQLVAPCGCVLGLLVADLDCLTSETALRTFVPRKRDRNRRVAAGWTVRLGTRAAGVALHLQVVHAYPTGHPRRCDR